MKKFFILVLFLWSFEAVGQNTSADSLWVSLNAAFPDSLSAARIDGDLFNHIPARRDSLSPLYLCREYNLIRIDSLHSRRQIDSFLNELLLKRGVVIDVLAASYISDVAYLKEQFRKKPVYKARVTYEGQELRNISWKEFPHLETCGIFRTVDSTLTPQKRGYMFSPDIYNFTDKNTKISGPKEFRAIKYELEEELSYSLPLRKDFLNQANLNSKSTAIQVKRVPDSEHGSVAYFNGSSSYIDIRSEQENRLEELSITAWIKPDEVSGSLSLVGKGEAFSAKIYHGQLQFTATGIEDHVTTEKVIEAGKWQHVGFVYVPRQKLYFYLNGKLIEEVPASDMKQTHHALLVGTNLWGQYYGGAMSELKIWNRALSDEEIGRVYLNKDEELAAGGLFTAGTWIWIAFLGIGIVGISFLLYRRKQEPLVEAPLPPEPKKPVIQRDFNRNSISLLNGFQVWNKEGQDITSKFSPKRRELLLLILLYTVKEGGITTKNLSDILWPGFSPSSKKNNRGTQVKEIRKIVEQQLDMELVFIDKKWQLQLLDSASIDVYSLNAVLPDFLRSRKVHLTAAEVLEFARLVSRGALLPQVEEEWLDSIKADYNSRVLDLLTPFLESETLSRSERLEVIDGILAVDPLFETAVRQKVSCLLSEGKYGSAKKIVENYKKLYESFYGELLTPEFMDLVK